MSGDCVFAIGMIYDIMSLYFLEWLLLGFMEKHKAPPIPMRGSAHRAEQNSEPAPTSITSPSSPLRFPRLQICTEARKGNFFCPIQAAVSRPTPDVPVTGKQFHKRLSVKDVFLASLYSYPCSPKNLEAAFHELDPPPRTLREVFLREIWACSEAEDERAQ